MASICRRRQLLLEANQWELNHGGLSGRTAQQFIDYLLGAAKLKRSKLRSDKKRRLSGVRRLQGCSHAVYSCLAAIDIGSFELELKIFELSRERA